MMLLTDPNNVTGSLTAGHIAAMGLLPVSDNGTMPIASVPGDPMPVANPSSGVITPIVVISPTGPTPSTDINAALPNPGPVTQPDNAPTSSVTPNSNGLTVTTTPAPVSSASPYPLWAIALGVVLLIVIIYFIHKNSK